MVRDEVEADQSGRVDDLARGLVDLTWLHQATPVVSGCSDLFRLSFVPSFEVCEFGVQEILDRFSGI